MKELPWHLLLNQLDDRHGSSPDQLRPGLATKEHGPQLVRFRRRRSPAHPQQHPVVAHVGVLPRAGQLLPDLTDAVGAILRSIGIGPLFDTAASIAVLDEVNP
jgi:hypothetical protein